MFSLYESEFLMPKKKDNVVRPFAYTKDTLIMDLLHRYAKRSEIGIATHGKTMVEATKPVAEWIEDAQEEAWDKIVYLEKLKRILSNLNIK